MNIKDFIEKARDLVDDINYTLWFGSKGSYTAKRNVGDKEIILEPFTLRPYRKGACKYTTNLTFWVCIRKSINDGKFNQKDGDDTEFIQMLVDETTKVIKQFNNSDFVSFTQRPETISLTYYEPNNNQSVNNQGMMRFSVPTEIYSEIYLVDDSPEPFISTWNTENTSSGSSPIKYIKLPLVSNGTYDFNVDWGDGTQDRITEWNQSEVEHEYTSGGTYTITITGTIKGWRFGNSGDRLKLLSVNNWGILELVNNTNGGYFYGCENMTGFTATGETNFEGITHFSQFFYGCSSLTSLDLSSFNTSAVTSMSAMFNECHALTELDVSNFDTSLVTDMRYMFRNCHALTSLDASNFDTSLVTNMSYMFSNCYALETLDVSNFNTFGVTDMAFMFYNCNALTELDVSNFDTSLVTDMMWMFRDCHALTNLDVSNFDTSLVTNMRYMFRDCHALTSLDVSNFDTSLVTNMSYMFFNCHALETLDVSNFDTSLVTDMALMFYNCGNLDISFAHFNVSGVTNFSNFMGGAGAYTPKLSCQNYDATLVSWSQQILVSDLEIHFGNSQFCDDGEVARQSIIDNYNWTITDGGRSDDNNG